MKVFEVITPPVHSVHKIKSTGEEFRKNMGIRNLTNYYGPRGIPDPQPKNKLVKVLGHGAYAGAVEVQGKNQVMKISRGTDSINDDPWYQYIARLANKDYTSNNPWFPRVYKMKVYETTDKVHKYFYIAFMEKLYPLTSLSHEELVSLTAKAIRPNLKTRIHATVSGYDPTKKLQKMDTRKLIETLVDYIRSHQVKDPQLEQALKFVLAFDDKNPDITEHNIMVRRTSDGPQLVLADPLKD